MNTWFDANSPGSQKPDPPFGAIRELYVEILPIVTGSTTILLIVHDAPHPPGVLLDPAQTRVHGAALRR